MRTTNDPKVHIAAARLTEGEREQLAKAARSAGISPSELLRRLIAATGEGVSVNKDIKGMPDILGLVTGDQQKGKAKPTAAGELIKELDSQPIWRNGKFYKGGLAQYRAEQRAKEQGENANKEVGWFPSDILTFADLEAYQQGVMGAIDDAEILRRLVSNVMGSAVENKSEALAGLGREFASRQAKRTLTKEDKQAVEGLEFAQLKLMVLDLGKAIEGLKG